MTKTELFGTMERTNSLSDTMLKTPPPQALAVLLATDFHQLNEVGKTWALQMIEEAYQKVKKEDFDSILKFHNIHSFAPELLCWILEKPIAPEVVTSIAKSPQWRNATPRLSSLFLEQSIRCVEAESDEEIIDFIDNLMPFYLHHENGDHTLASHKTMVNDIAQACLRSFQKTSNPLKHQAYFFAYLPSSDLKEVFKVLKQQEQWDLMASVKELKILEGVIDNEQYTTELGVDPKTLHQKIDTFFKKLSPLSQEVIVSHPQSSWWLKQTDFAHFSFIEKSIKKNCPRLLPHLTPPSVIGELLPFALSDQDQFFEYMETHATTQEKKKIVSNWLYQMIADKSHRKSAYLNLLEKATHWNVKASPQKLDYSKLALFVVDHEKEDFENVLYLLKDVAPNNLRFALRLAGHALQLKTPWDKEDLKVPPLSSSTEQGGGLKNLTHKEFLSLMEERYYKEECKVAEDMLVLREKEIIKSSLPQKASSFSRKKM